MPLLSHKLSFRKGRNLVALETAIERSLQRATSPDHAWCTSDLIQQIFGRFVGGDASPEVQRLRRLVSAACKRLMAAGLLRARLTADGKVAGYWRPAGEA